MRSSSLPVRRSMSFVPSDTWVFSSYGLRLNPIERLRPRPFYWPEIIDQLGACVARKPQPTARQVLGSSLHLKRYDVNLPLGAREANTGNLR